MQSGKENWSRHLLGSRYGGNISYSALGEWARLGDSGFQLGQSGNLEGLPDSHLRNIIIISVIVLFLLLPTNSS